MHLISACTSAAQEREEFHGVHKDHIPKCTRYQTHASEIRHDKYGLGNFASIFDAFMHYSSLESGFDSVNYF